MGLSTPLALLAVALIGLPILAHLVRRADVERRVLPTVALLRRVLVRDRRRARITEPWLLALRVIAVLAAALALAAPFVVDRLAYGDGSAIAVVLVVDDSASMTQAAPGQASALDRALERAREVIRSVGDGSEIAIVLAGSPARLAVPRTDDRAAALAALDRVRAEARRTDLDAALTLASRQLAAAHLAARRTIVLSDFAAPLEEDALSTSRAAPGAELELVPLGVEDATNTGISDVHVEPDPLEAGAYAVSVELGTFGPEPASARTLSVVAIPAGAGLPTPDAPELTRASASFVGHHARATLRFRPPDGVTHAAIRLVDASDSLAIDDQRIIALRGPRATHVVLVEPATAHTARFLARALAAVPPERGGFFVTTVDVDHLAGARGGTIDPGESERTDMLAGADVLVLAGAVPTAPAALAALRAFVEGGGGLLVAPAPATRAIDLAALTDLVPARTGSIEAVPAGSTLTAGPLALLAPGPTGLESVTARSRVALDASADRVVLSFSDGAPLLVLDPIQRRASLAVGLDDAMSDLPLRVGFVPLAITLVRALARPGALPDRPFAGGEVPALHVPADTSEVDVITPTGEIRTRAPERGVVTLDDLAEAGAYAARVHGARGIESLDRASFVIVPPSEEIDLTPHVPELAAEPAGSREAEGEAHVPIDRWLFALVGVLAAIEAWARLWRPARGAAPGGASASGIPRS